MYGWGIVAPGAKNVAALEALLREGKTALRNVSRPELGQELFAVGDPDFSIDDSFAWIAERKGEPFATRLKKKMGDNVLFALGATVEAMSCNPKLETLAKELDEACHVYVGSGVGDLPQSYEAARSLDRATRAWNQFWADPIRCAARKIYEETGDVTGPAPPVDPKTLPVDSEERLEARLAWDTYWAARSSSLREFLVRLSAVEALGSTEEGPEAPASVPARGSSPPRASSPPKALSEKAHLDAIRRRVRALRALLDEVGCPAPPWTAVSPDLIWNIQNAPAAQITMLLDVHGAAWAPVGACSTFGVALKCGRDAILRGEAKMAIVGTTDPRPDPGLVGAFHSARVMAGTGEVNAPFTSLRGTHLSGGSCIWILGDEEYFAARGLTPVGGWVESIALSSDAEHIITPSVSGPKRALSRAFEEAGVGPKDIAIADLHATGTPGDLNELALVESYVGEQTRITARKGQLGHGMANSGGWELTALALGLRAGEAYATGIEVNQLHPNVRRPEAIVGKNVPIAEGTPKIGFKLMLGIGGITSCVVMSASK
ncbi:MAG TPA: beta-ketoacyl synthase N-terminal-like domain-containing protein [Labilithrix sp.]|nr:beta-ketoacyl synthase N-terminal-like domain-containing protein [Labilithrix sp.]